MIIRQPITANKGNQMIQVFIEITNVVWENDQDGDIAFEAGTTLQFIADIPDHDNLTSEEIDEAIADAVESIDGHRPKSWVVNIFSDLSESA